MAKAAVKPERTIRDKAFANRLNAACDNHPRVPPYNYGRLTWVRQQLIDMADVEVSMETVRKWFSGEARPRPDKMKKIAELLSVDEAWLSLGITPEMNPDDRKSYMLASEGAVNLVAGMVQLSGNSVATPDQKDPRAKGMNLLAIIKGKIHPMYVALGAEVDGGYKFVVPADHVNNHIIGVVPVGHSRYDILHLITETLEKHADMKGGFGEVVVRKDGSDYMTRKDVWPKIKSFADRL